MIALLALTAGVALVPVGQGRAAAKQTLLVTFFPNSSVSVSLPDGTPVGTAAGSPTLIPAGYYGLQLSGPGGCVQEPLFHLRGPGEDFVNDMIGGEVTSQYFDAFFAPNSTYTWRTDNSDNGTVYTFVTGPVVQGVAPAAPTFGGSTSTKPTSQDIVGSGIQPVRGTLAGKVSASGALSVAFKGKSLSHLAAGRYRIAVTDRSSSRGFILQKKAHKPVAVTGSRFVGTRSLTVDLTSGTWSFEPQDGKTAYSVVVG
jgi:hypothetical protein